MKNYGYIIGEKEKMHATCASFARHAHGPSEDIQQELCLDASNYIGTKQDILAVAANVPAINMAQEIVQAEIENVCREESAEDVLTMQPGTTAEIYSDLIVEGWNAYRHETAADLRAMQSAKVFQCLQRESDCLPTHGNISSFLEPNTVQIIFRDFKILKNRKPFEQQLVKIPMRFWLERIMTGLIHGWNFARGRYISSIQNGGPGQD